ncbi:CopD family protein [Hoyosella subflava]|uniref:Copper resistance protein n=1 Tax=Hoyosella subflava (strain DSM 45089 / JCM 17490 / NBRC 109087 / DQS3-9A1) TaxID=443218 RepID=F6ERI7_HOYSD|nr:CopD family protein [Hoyosella subflava]AEF38507.1 Copper resistance protein [Hoyosella subflava DQS3-9A1]
MVQTARDARHLLWAAVPAVVGGAIAATLIAQHDAATAALTRAVTLGSGVVTLGLCAYPWLLRAEHGQRKRAAARDVRRWRMISVFAAAWGAAAIAGATASAANLADVTVDSLSIDDLATYFVHILSGRISLLVIGCALLLSVAAVVVGRHASPEVRRQWDVPAACVALLGVLALPLAGHASHQTLTAVLITAHTAAAALWCGLLAALALFARSRAEWATALPAFSRLAASCIAVVAVTGIASAAALLESPIALVSTGYGQVLIGKAIVLSGLFALGWWWRRVWVRAVVGHRGDANVSIRRAATEVALMAIAFGLAASLATTP